jgi:hypothetical protein
MRICYFNGRLPLPPLRVLTVYVIDAAGFPLKIVLGRFLTLIDADLVSQIALVDLVIVDGTITEY